MNGTVIKTRKPLEVVGWLGSAGYQTITIRPANGRSSTSGKEARVTATKAGSKQKP